MKNYDWILFDLDETLLRFDSHNALKKLFFNHNIILTDDDHAEYETKNKSLWQAYQDRKITLRELQHQRFTAWGNKLNISPFDLDDAFLAAITDITVPLDGAVNLLNGLKGKTKIGAITNGFIKTQQIRVERVGLYAHFDFILTSEEAGIPKPHPSIFEHAFSRMENPLRENILMVGDSLEADILGGINAGIDTCWLNPHKKIAPDHITPQYEIASLQELENLLMVHN